MPMHRANTRQTAWYASASSGLIGIFSVSSPSFTSNEKAMSVASMSSRLIGTPPYCLAKSGNFPRAIPRKPACMRRTLTAVNAASVAGSTSDFSAGSKLPGVATAISI